MSPRRDELKFCFTLILESQGLLIFRIVIRNVVPSSLLSQVFMQGFTYFILYRISLYFAQAFVQLFKASFWK